MFQDLTDTVAGIGDSQETLRGTIRILGGMTVCLYVFPTLLSELTRQHPGVEVKIINDSTERCIQHLRAGTGDLALLTLPIKDADMVTVPVLQEELLVVTAAKHPLSKKRKVSAGDLAQQPFVLFESGSNTRRVIDEFFAARQDRAAHRDGDRERRDHQGAWCATASASPSSRTSRWPATWPAATSTRRASTAGR